MTQKFLQAACFLLAIGVACGAFGAHGLAERVSTKELAIWETAVFYHLFHALSMLVLGLRDDTAKKTLGDAVVQRIQQLLFFGIIVFSGSLYLLVLTQIRWLGAITPVGGLSFIAAWVFMAIKVRTLDSH